MREHPLAVLDLTTAEAARAGPVEAGRMALETDAFQTVVAFPKNAADKPDHHDAHDIPET